MHISQVLAAKAKTCPISVIKPGRFISPAQAGRFISMVQEAAKSQDVEWVLIGGLAMQWHGSPRLTGNCDIAVTSLMGFRGLEPVRYADNIGRRKWIAPDGSRLTLLSRSDGYQSLYEAAIVAAHVENGLRVVQPEYLAAMKFACQDVDHDLDLQWLLRRSPEGLIDLSKAAEIVSKHLGGQFAETMFRKAVDQAACDLEMNGTPARGDYP